ncbi:PQQ-like beta-propeller repeat protein [Telmatocola sphagniphila]|uniref:PQQ-like beta-propeller repeat protein n=1 Tax=Telmatocola sphagniphila TaxID=1123043 RepID=A0A8E6EZN2_9BACT|nr:PQQ-binding-like beta-propeller repeat protein [Telmatocola sphagniphila]QVL33656.1 PQQ-like beta-propeller repeat protein [Telmatocola sphagniphila]
MIIRTFRFLYLVTLVAWSSPAFADNWPSWRGPDNLGISTEKNIPSEWSDEKNIAWKAKMPGIGASTPVVWGDKIFLSSEEGDSTVLLCLDAKDGKEIWKQKVGIVPKKPQFQAGENSAATSSPSTDGKHVWVAVGSGELACFDVAGKEIWKFNAQERYGKFKYQFGMHSTPVLYGDKLYWQLIHSIPGYVICIDAKTGEEVWKVVRKSDGIQENEHSYASTMIWHNGDKAYLLAHGNDYCTAHDLKDGSEIWRVTELNAKAKYDRTLRFVASPLATPELIIVPTAKRGPVVAVKPDAKGTFGPGSEFEQFRFETTPDVPSPLLKDGLVYLCSASGQLTCLDAKTGKAYYKNERFHEAKYRSSPVYADGKIYLSGHDGTVTVVKAGEKFEILAKNRLNDRVSASPVISNGRLYIRGFDNLYAIGTLKSTN